MKRIKIENWNIYGDYMFFANLVDEVGKWIMLETQGSTITAIGKEDAIQAFTKLLDENNVQFEYYML